MKNHNVIFERDINKSYMKVPSIEKENFDEKLILMKNFSGTLFMEKSFVDGKGQYWYHISGRQALEDFCNFHEIGKTFFETLLLRICNQLEVLEWNLVDTNCLVLCPEYIFLNSTGEDISFVLYPGNIESIDYQLRGLLEYLLTKLNHEDSMVVKMAYQIYEMVLSENYSVTDIKNMILEAQRNRLSMEKKKDVVLKNEGELMQKEEIAEASERFSFIHHEKLVQLFDKILSILQMEPKDFFFLKKEEKEELPEVIYPDVTHKVETICEQHPTVCLSSILKKTEGRLEYEGREQLEDFKLDHMVCLVGKNNSVKLQIEKNTISNFHARINYLEGEYYIEDMNSTNGTFVNEELLNYKEVRKLCPGDTVRFADVKYRFL